MKTEKHEVEIANLEELRLCAGKELIMVTGELKGVPTLLPKTDEIVMFNTENGTIAITEAQFGKGLRFFAK